MTMTRFHLTLAVQQRIMSGIRAGAYGHVAAEACGIPRRVYQRWLKLGQGKKARPPYADFAAEVQSALAQARLRAEMTAFTKDAKAWLEHGPGRETPDNPGWTGPVKPPEPAAGPEPNPLLDPEFMKVCRRVLEELLPFPEAHARVAETLAPSNNFKISTGEHHGFSPSAHSEESATAGGGTERTAPPLPPPPDPGR